METYIKITIELKDNSLRDILIAQLSECGFEGFEEEQYCIYAFIDQEKFSKTDFEKIISSNGAAYTKTIIAPENWNEEWEKNFEPVLVEDFCAIRASFHQPIISRKHEIIITPKMSFGTGHHATTWLMIKTIGAIDCKEKTVLDFGTGTGVLAILAEKCGAKEVIAIDYDEWSIENAAENIGQNNCSKIVLQKNDSIRQTGRFDIILANINKHVILHSLVLFQQHLNVNGVLILSGLLSTDFADTENEAHRNNFQVLSKLEKENWVCIVLNGA